MRFIRRFMLSFGPISSVFDFFTFGVLLFVLHAGPAEFRSGWFVDSLATQTLIIFAIRTRRIPFFRSHPSLPMTLAAMGVVIVGALLPATPLGHLLGFRPLPLAYYAVLAVLVVAYLALVEVGKRLFYGRAQVARPPRRDRSGPTGTRAGAPPDSAPDDDGPDDVGPMALVRGPQRHAG
jgi:Mg2+-importing ATPase